MRDQLRLTFSVSIVIIRKQRSAGRIKWEIDNVFNAVHVGIAVKLKQSIKKMGQVITAISNTDNLVI